MRVRRYSMHVELLTTLIGTGHTWESAEVVGGVPTDPRPEVVGVGAIWGAVDEAQMVYVDLRHPSFADVPEGAVGGTHWTIVVKAKGANP